VNSATKRAGRERKRRRTPILEWIAAAIGLVLALAVTGLVAWDALNQDGAPPHILVEARTVTAFDAGFVLEVRLRNVANATAAQVAIEGVLSRGGQTVETARATFDYLPGNSVRHGGLFFSNDPRGYVVSLRALGYAEP
jgi:uncharacterized protein (TIGR02588 family)